MTAPWPYQDVEDTEEVPAPTWACPEALCDCASPDAEAELFEYSAMLTADDGSRMPGARVRVLLNGVEVNRDDPYADEEGFITFTFREQPVSVRLEWAPSDTPLEARYPYRSRHWVTLADEGDELADEAHVRRLANLGFHLGLAVEDNVETFQRRYGEAVTRKLEDIAPRLVAYHDVSTAPVVEQGTTSSFALASTRRGSTAQKPPNDAQSKGKQKKGGGTKQGSGTAAPAVLDRLVLKISARFALDAALTRRWENKSHLSQILPCKVTMTGQGFSDVIATTDTLASTDTDITKTLSLVTVQAAKGGVCTITIEPPSKHELTRGSEERHVPVGKDDRPTGLATEDCLFRPLVFDVEIAADGELKKVEQPHECVSPLNGGNSEVANGATLKKASNTILVDWRPDYIQGASSTKKAPATAGSGPGAGIKLDAEMFVAIHQTSSSGAKIGTNINTFTNAASGVGIHYIVDRNGFVVKMANDDVQCTHAGGEMGAAWKTFIARGQTNTLSPADTVASINALTVGIEHVHEASSGQEQKMGLSAFTDAQMDGSVELLKSLGAASKEIFTHNMVGLLKSNQLGYKLACAGTGYVWSKLEAAGLRKPMKYNYNFATAGSAEIAAVSWSNTKGQIDAAADGTGVVKTVQEALRKIGFFLPAINDQFDAATTEACRSFMLRYFGGPDRTSGLADVQDAKSGLPKVNTVFLIALFEARDQ